MREEIEEIEEPIDIIEGNILDYDIDIIIQQVNCQGVMGGGFSKEIMNKYPEVAIYYEKYYKERKKEIILTEELLGEVLYVETYDSRIIANVFGQDFIRNSPTDKEVYTKEWALLKGINEVKDKAYELGLSVGLPTYIGCGMGNGDWSIIKPKIESIFEYSGVNVKFYNYII